MFDRPFWRGLTRLAVIATVCAAANAVGAGLVQLAAWWFTNR
ncbi:hypothetical protein [Streptomyces flavalbus]|uniref:Uncharacterized protein n=1 Tax=Streptomyces flavalbus TaxID=2665155 RepID=A0ABW2WEQ3_9ACTN